VPSRSVALLAAATLLACASGVGTATVGAHGSVLDVPTDPSSAPSMQMLAPHATSPAADEVAVVSWNVHVGGGDLTRLVRDLRDGRLTSGTVPDAFVLLLQEVHRSGDHVLTVPDGGAIHALPPSGGRLDITSVATALGLHVAYAPAVANGRPSPDEPPEDRGVAIVSSHPLGGVEVFELPRERQRRVAIAATVRGTQTNSVPWSLRVASAHLENRASWGRVFDSFGAARGRQARALVEALGPDPVVLGADLNTWALSILEPAFGILGEHFPDSPWSAEPTFSLAGVARSLDHLLFRLPGEPVPEVSVVADRYGSDHAPVVGVVTLNGSSPGEAQP
jgi:endonuclease/exonuclease/phosphatase family metal-dependent hydrolase